ncbi:MAG: DUF2911 domain-containing protein [Bacteroidetes bacterium]|nr:DUF2911 domain-containing protein [Bacteroidota bacterium]
MKRVTFIFKATGFIACAILVSLTALAQESPRENVKGTVNGANITIDYGSPSVRGRKIWGELVPYDQIWRTGANPATTIEISKDINVEGKTLHAGKYSLFTIPGTNEWKVIFNSETGQWGIRYDGSANDDPAKDVLTVTVKPEKAGEFHERMTFAIDPTGFRLLWENLAVPVKIN